MRSKRYSPLILVGILALLASGTPAASAGTTTPSATGYARPELLAETDWLAQHLRDADLRIVDLRSQEAYTGGHIPGAVWLDGARLDDPKTGYVPKPESFATLMAGLGIGDRTRVVAYDDQGGLWATRLWWALDYYGHTKAKVLNGGWNKWTKEGRRTTKEVVATGQVTFTPKVNQNVICAVDYVKANLKRPEVVIVDARSQAEYTGMDVRAKRGGHIPGAVNIDWQRNLTAGESKTFKPADELLKMYEAAGITRDKKIVTYCQTGVRAAHALFTLRLLGYENARNYDGSWAEWGNSAGLPIEK